jgi:aminocarboxymuconate-semialdehyde decarboxylase
MLQFIVDLVGANRVCLGTDYPFPLGEDIPGELIKTAGFDQFTQDILLEKSALEWLKMDRKLFI